MKILETHDLFWKRAEIFARMGMKPEFFVTTEASELFGVQRADLAVTIEGSEGAELFARTGKPVITVPFYDAELASVGQGARRPSPYLSPDKVTFGVLATPNSFNIFGLNALLQSLEQVIAETFAPVELIVGGKVSEFVEKRAGVRCVGYVPDESSFFASVDYAIAPVFDGTGFKVKTADALALHMPTLLSAHAAKGVEVDRSLVCDGPEDMARRMARFALERPPLSDTLAKIRRARATLARSAQQGAEDFLAVISQSSQPLVIALSTAHEGGDALVLQSYLCALRAMTEFWSIVLLLGEELCRKLGKLVPRGVKVMTPEHFDRARKWAKLVVVDVFGDTDLAAPGFTADDILVCDVRWRKRPAPEGKHIGVLGPMPLFNDSLTWEPAALTLMAPWQRRLNQDFCQNGATRKETSVNDATVRVIYLDRQNSGTRLPHSSPVLRNRRLDVFVEIEDWEHYQQSIIAILLGRVHEVVYAARPDGIAHRAVMESCLRQKIPYWGRIDDAALSAGSLTHHLEEDLNRSVSQTLHNFATQVAVIQRGQQLGRSA